jgi:hypothetical protein
VSASLRRIALVALFVVLALGAAHDLLRLGDGLPWRKMYDFQDFYCAGEAVARGADPYRYEPLHACEHRVANGTPAFAQHADLVIPAPQPPYDFLPFALLARLDFHASRTAYAIVLLLAVAGSVWALARTGIPADVGAVAFLLPVAYLELGAGQIVPFALLALCCAGAALAARRDALAGACAALTAIEPHLGIPVIAAVVLFAARARLGALLTVAALAAISVAVTGAPTTWEYLVRVLPAHASAELLFPYQYGSSYALHALGVPAGAAQALGALAYLVLLAAGVWLAPRVAVALRRREMLAFVPAACAVTAAPFLHMEELCFALPAALAFAIALRGTARTVSAVALCFLIVPWIMAWAIKKLFLLTILVCLYTLVRLGISPGAIALFVSSLAAVLYGLEFRSPNLPMPHAAAVTANPLDLAQIQWRAFTEQLATRDPRWLLIKVPSWAALFALIAVALRQALTHARQHGARLTASIRRTS